MIGVGIIGGSDIAYRMFLPSLLENENFKCIGIATNNPNKKEKFSKSFNIPVYDDYNEIINNPQVDAVYIPLPPALHYKWAKMAIEVGKHVFIEKPSTNNYKNTYELVTLAEENGVVIHENYMFQYHNQLQIIKDLINSGKIGDIRLIKCSFGFPLREMSDFRYNKELGGGALLDAGGYVIKLATILLGDTIRVQCANQNMIDNFEVDMYGNVSFVNDKGLVCQGAYGFDCYYQCNLEVWGNRGKLTTNRIFTAPPNLSPIITIETNGGKEDIEIIPDNHFSKSLDVFYSAIDNIQIREKLRKEILLQSKLLEEIKSLEGGQ